MSTMLAAIYARYSTDRQRETSVDDQIKVCSTKANAENWSIIATYADNGISGSVPVGSRSGGSDLLSDNRYTVLLIEGLDRLSRDLAEQEMIVRRLEFRGVRLIGVADGYDSEMSGKLIHRGMRGIINQVYLEDLRHKTHRGLSGQVDRGLFAGGTPYGYLSIEVEGGHNLVIQKSQAKWVKWIFQRYLEGMSHRGIAHELNRLRVPSPRGSTWAVSAIYGSPAKGTGILNNDVYRGIYIWNRSKWVKNPDTGKRTRIDRPESEWKQIERPDLQIISDELWQNVKRAQKSRSFAHIGTRKPPRTLLGGLLRCGECGATYIAVNAHSYGCSYQKDRGTCQSPLVPRKSTESALIDLIKDDLLTDEAVHTLKDEVRRILNDQRNQDGQIAQAAELDREINHLTDAIARMGFSAALQQRLEKAESNRRELHHQMAQIPNDLPEFIPRLLDRYRAVLEELPSTLKDNSQAARQALVDLLGDVRIVKDGNEVFAEIKGLYSGTLNVATNGSGGRI